jgi:basic amino acid/polyamine antiporter, APA family
VSDAAPIPDATYGHEPALRRRLGLFAVSMSGVGIILGAGIYVLVGEAAGQAGNAVWLAFVIAAVVAAPTGLAFAELAAMFPDAGASASYAREALGVRFGFITGWLDLAVSIVGAAAVAIGFGSYFDDLLAGGTGPVAIAVLIACGIITYIGVREMITVAVIFTVLEASGLIIVIAVGIPELGGVPLFDIEPGWFGVLGAASLVYFAYQGFEEIATLSEETVNPTRNIPRAIVISVIVTTTLYVLVAVVAVSALPWQLLAESNAPLADVVAAVSSDRLADAVSVIALFATFNTVLLLIATGARLSYGMAARRLLPVALARVSASRGTPWVATLVITLLSIMLAATGDISFVAQVTNFSVFGLFALVNVSVIALRRSRPHASRPFQLPGSIRGVPLIAVAGLIGNLMLALFMDGEAFRAGMVLLGIGLVASVFAVKYEREAA